MLNDNINWNAVMAIIFLICMGWTIRDSIVDTQKHDIVMEKLNTEITKNINLSDSIRGETIKVLNEMIELNKTK